MQGIVLRAETSADLAFLQDLYATTREREMAFLVSWTGAQKVEFLNSQFDAQHQHYTRHYPNAAFSIIERDQQRIGRFYVATLTRQVVLMDITLLPVERNSGIGTQLCQDLIAAATRQKKVVSLHVEDDNPARRLYDRLGFVEIAEVTFYKLMHWIPPGLQHVSDQIAAELDS